MSGTDGGWTLEAGAGGGDDELGGVGEVDSRFDIVARVLFDSLFSHESGEWLSCTSAEDFVRGGGYGARTEERVGTYGIIGGLEDG